MGDAADEEEPVLLVEAEELGDTFATGVYPPVDCGDHVRIDVYADRPSTVGDHIERRVISHLVFTKSAFLAAREVIRPLVTEPSCPPPSRRLN